MPIYLYVKTHNLTGLKYIGKTKQDPYKYRGSGVDWIAHLKLYGEDVKTDVIMECKNNEELSFWGRYYSKYYNVMYSMDDYGNKIWANRIPETGGGMGRSGFHKGQNNPMYGKKRDDLSGPNSPNKLLYRRNQSSQQLKDQWKDATFRDNISKHKSELWLDPEYIKKMRARPKPFKRVIINDVEYESLRAAAKSLNLDPTTISKRCTSIKDKWANWKYI